MRDLSLIVKAYDVRGVVPDQLNVDVARAIGAAFVQTLRAGGELADTVVTAHDMRESSPGLATAFGEGARSEGANVIEAGLGGRWDATNAIESRVAVLTNVGLEHTRWLGPTVRDIAREKLAVVRPGSTLVVGADLHPDALEEAGMTMAKRLAAGPTHAIQFNKRLVNKMLEDQVSRLYDMALAFECVTFDTDDHREAVDAFEAADAVHAAGQVKEVVAVVNGMVASAAAYAIASAATLIVTASCIPYFIGGLVNFKRILYIRAQEQMFASWGIGAPARLAHLIAKPFVWANWRGLESLLKAQFKLGKCKMVPETRIEDGVNCSVPIATPGFFPMVAEWLA